MKPICMPCRRFFQPDKNGFYFKEGRPLGDKVPPGASHDQFWADYKIWCGDVWRCHGCGQQIIVGTARQPLAEHYHSDFNKIAESLHAKFRVNDC
jgi:hypothetical protein